MEYVTPEQMAKEEVRAAAAGVGVERLMEKAGAEVAREVERRYGPVFGKRVVILAGNGNNGGDGFVAARYLASKGSRVEVILLSSPDRIKTIEAETNWRRLEQTEVERVVLGDRESLSRSNERIERADILIDAIFGTGIEGEVREPHSTAINLFNQSRGRKVALDIPSGLDPLSGKAKGTTVRAEVTVTLHKAKVGLIRGREYAGEIVVVPIGIP